MDDLRKAPADVARCGLSLGRYPVTVAQLYSNFDADTTYYIYFEEEAALGLDPWRVGSGLDKTTHGDRYILEWGRCGCLEVDADYVVYFAARDMGRANASP